MRRSNRLRSQIGPAAPGSAPGDSGNSLTDARVNATDEIAARNDPHSALSHASIFDPNDYNRDSLLNATDEIAARNNSTTAINALKLILAPATMG